MGRQLPLTEEISQCTLEVIGNFFNGLRVNFLERGYAGELRDLKDEIVRRQKSLQRGIDHNNGKTPQVAELLRFHLISQVFEQLLQMTGEEGLIFIGFFLAFLSSGWLARYLFSL